MGRKSAISRFNNQRGDTIVEVLISVVIIATILSGAFLVAQSSSHNIQASQEHGYALQQIQAQVELIRGLAGKGDPALKAYAQGRPFCAFATPSGQIQVNNGSSSTCQNVDNRYMIGDVMTKAADPAIPGDLTVYKVEITWDKLGGGVNRESLLYGVELK